MAVLGLGRFGAAVARELARLGHEVLAIDADPKIAQDLTNEVTHVAEADITDGDALRELGVGDFDAAVVGVSSNLEASILSTVLLRRLGVNRIVAKAANELHGSILEQVGADRVVYPERETGIRLAHSFAARGVLDYLDVAPDYGLARIQAPSAWSGRSLGELDLSRQYGVSVVLLVRRGRTVLTPTSDERLRDGDALIIAGLDENLERVPGWF